MKFWKNQNFAVYLENFFDPGHWSLNAPTPTPLHNPFLQYFFQMFFYTTSILILLHTASSISVASTPSPYTQSSNEASYSSPSTPEPSVEYKSSNPHGPFPYARQFFEPLFTPSNQYAESLTSPSPLTPKPFLFHRLPFLPSAPYSNPAYPDQPSPYGFPTGYFPQQTPYNLPAYPNQPLFDPHYPSPFPQKFGRNPYLPDCDFHPISFRNTKPLLFYPNKPDNYYDSQLAGKPSNAFYRFQPPPYAANFASNIYH